MGKNERAAEYERYLNSSTWRNKRQLALAAAGNKCSRCGKSGPGLHVHHLHYRNFGSERAEDLRVLCKKCHEAVHAPKKKLVRQDKARVSIPKKKGRRSKSKVRVCRACGKDFFPRDYAAGGGVTCSPECKARHRKREFGLEYRGIQNMFPEKDDLSWVEEEKTTAGGWTKEILSKHGIPWPPPKGWKTRSQ